MCESRWSARATIGQWRRCQEMTYGIAWTTTKSTRFILFSGNLLKTHCIKWACLTILIPLILFELIDHKKQSNCWWRWKKTVQATWLHWSQYWRLASSHDLLRNYRGDKGFCHATLKQGLTNAEFVFTKEMSDSSHVNNLHRFRPTDRNGDQRWQSQTVSSSSMLHTCCWLRRIADERG